MSFLDRFAPDHRRLFEGAATILKLPRGQFLLRRGEPGGDVYLLREGTLEVVDTRAQPEVILAQIEEGATVGEMAFIDDSPRSADVRAAADCELLRWSRDDLRALLTRQPALAATFYEQVARLATDRIRSTTSSAFAASLTRTEPRSAAGLSRVREEARRIAETVKEGLLDTETRLRQDPGDKEMQQKVRALLDLLQEEVRVLFTTHPEPDAAAAGAQILRRELHPYLVRSSLAERCIRRPTGVSGAAEILAHVLVDSAGGDGQLGELIDRWLLDRPMLRALRQTREPLLDIVQTSLPKHRNRRVLVVPAGTGSLVASLTHVLGHPPTVLTVVDQSRDALAFLDAGLSVRPRAVQLETVQENLAAFAMGRGRAQLPPQDLVVLHGLMEYVPDRIAVSLLGVAKGLLAPHGAVVATALGPSDDQELLDWLLHWPSIRRTREGFRRLFLAAGLPEPDEREMHPPAMLLVGRVSEQAAQPAAAPLANARTSA